MATSRPTPPQVTQTQLLVGLLVVAAFLIGLLLPRNGLQLGTSTVPTGSTPPGAAGAAPQPGQKVSVSNGHLPVLGNKNAKVTIVEWADFRCPFCEQVFTNVEPNLKKDYIDTGKVQFYFRHFAFLGPASTVAANAAECANEQGKFWDFHDYLYKNQPPETDTSMYTVDNMTQAAGTLGMNTEQFRSCLSTNKYQSKIDQDYQDGQKAGITGTPGFVINGKLTIGAQPYSNFKTIIDQDLK